MTTPAYLVLEDGSRYRGEAFGARTSSYGEVVFSTSMTGYQEMLTDPSFAGQIVMPTYPLIGNYGINARDVESRRVQVSGFVVRRHDTRPSHSLSDMTLDEYLQGQGIAGIAGVDTRAITRRLRSRGVMMGAITVDESPEVALRRIAEMPPTPTWTSSRASAPNTPTSGTSPSRQCGGSPGRRAGGTSSALTPRSRLLPRLLQCLYGLNRRSAPNLPLVSS